MGSRFDQAFLRRRHSGSVGPHCLPHAVDPRFSLFESNLVRFRVDAEEQFTSLNPLIVGYAEFEDATRDLGGDAHDIGLHDGLRRIRRHAVGDNRVEKYDDDHA